MKALVGAFNQEKALVGAFSVIVQPVVEPMEHYTALILMLRSAAAARDGGAAGGSVQQVRHQGPRLDRDRGVQADLHRHGHLHGTA